MTMKHKFVVAAFIAVTMALSTAAQAIGFNIDIGDRGYYNHGPRYYDGDWAYNWVPGHRYHCRWIHGHYRRRQRRH